MKSVTSSAGWPRKSSWLWVCAAELDQAALVHFAAFLGRERLPGGIGNLARAGFVPVVVGKWLRRIEIGGRQEYGRRELQLPQDGERVQVDVLVGVIERNDEDLSRNRPAFVGVPHTSPGARPRIRAEEPLELLPKRSGVTFQVGGSPRNRFGDAVIRQMPKAYVSRGRAPR